MKKVTGSKLGWVCAAFGILLPGTGYTWDWLPEFQSLTETEEAIFEDPSRFGSEYPADIVSYLKPAEWEYDWLAHSQVIDASIGSLSARHFLIDNRLKIHAQLSERFEFRFTYANEQDLERDSVHHILETIWWPAEKLGLSFYGEPALYKRDNDTGLALILKPQTRHEIRIFQTFVDVTRLRRSDRSDNFIEPDLPYSRGIIGRWWSDPAAGKREFFEYGFRQDTKTRWRFPEQGYDYEYWKGVGTLFGSKAVAENIDLTFRAQWDRKHEARLRIPDSSLEPSLIVRTDRFLTLLRGVFKRLGPDQAWTLTGGAAYSDRSWRTSRGHVKYRDVVPHLIWRLPGFGKNDRKDHWMIGYLTTWHRAWGPASLREWGDRDGESEHRVNLSYEFSFGEKARLSLMVTGDLDRAFTDKSWDGGGGQFQMFF